MMMESFKHSECHINWRLNSSLTLTLATTCHSSKLSEMSFKKENTLEKNAIAGDCQGNVKDSTGTQWLCSTSFFLEIKEKITSSSSSGVVRRTCCAAQFKHFFKWSFTSRVNRFATWVTAAVKRISLITVLKKQKQILTLKDGNSLWQTWKTMQPVQLLCQAKPEHSQNYLLDGTFIFCHGKQINFHVAQ